ncbi:MAG: carbohydrate kinase family protein [Planctomycetia bacterium]|nr:carbohydrate kinase family protein [Planctomycetia bacterium]
MNDLNETPTPKAQTSPKAIVAGHLCLDIIPDLSKTKSASKDGNFVVPGRLIRIGAASLALGGAVSNTGIAFAKLGVNAELMGKIGDDLLGKTILEAFRKQGIPNLDFTSGMIIEPGEVSSYTIVVSPPEQDRCFLHCSGANDTFAPKNIPLHKLSGARLLHFGYPTLMRQIYSNPAEFAAQLAEVRKLGLLVSLDVTMPDASGPEGEVDWRRWFEIVLKEVDIFLPSLEETLFMLNRPMFEEISRRALRVTPPPGASVNPAAFLTWEQIESLAQELLDLGVEVAGIKLGDEGLFVKTQPAPVRVTEGMPWEVAQTWRNRAHLAPCFDVKVVGTTGSGDCTIAGFLTGLLEGWALPTTMDFATAVGACNVQAMDATSGIPPRAGVLERMQTWERKVSKIQRDGKKHL